MKTKRIHGGLARKQRGLSLIEILIGMVLSLIILSAVASVFVGSSTSFRQQESSSAVQESGRIALEVLNRDIRMVGNPGCGNLGYMTHRSASFQNSVALASAPGATAAAPDAITLTRGSAETAIVSSSASATAFTLVSLGTLGAIEVGDKLLLSDCASTDVMVVTAVTGNVITGTGLAKPFRPGSQVMRLETVAYTVAGGELLRSVNGAAPQAVAGSVSDLKFLYGVAGSVGRSAKSYISAPTAAQLASTVAVKLSLTVADGQPQVSQIFSSTVALRNRAP